MGTEGTAGWLRWPRSEPRRIEPTQDVLSPTTANWLTRQIEQEEAARSGFALIPLGLITGAVLTYGAGLRIPIEGIAGLLALAIAAFIAVRHGRIIGPAALWGVCTVFGLGLAQAELSRTKTTLFSGEATVFIEARVVWREGDDRGRIRYVLDVERTERPTLSRPPERVRILVSSKHEPLAIGGTYRGLVRLRPPSGPAFPGAHDFAFAPYFQGLGAYGFSLGAPEAGLAPPTTTSFSEDVASVRSAIAVRIRALMPGAEGAVAAALVTGERAAIPDEIEEWLRITGLSHVLSISGLHMALVAGFVMLSVRAGLSLVPVLPLHVSTKKIAAVAAFLVSTGYLLLAGDNVATQRSYIMLVIMLGSVLLDRPAITLRNVAMSAVVVVALTPHAVMTASFQMSFAATAALVGAYGALVAYLSRSEGERSRDRGLAVKLAIFLGALALSSFIAGSATIPFGAYHFQRMAPLGLVANVLAMPLFSFWIMPLALAGTLAMPFGLDAWFFKGMELGLTAVFRMAETLAHWLPDSPVALMSSLSLLLFSAAILSVCFFASVLRMVAIPLALLGILAAPLRSPLPELLVFEDGKEVALLGFDGAVLHRKDRPNGFVADQWERAFARSTTAADTPSRLSAFSCEAEICRATTRSGLQIAWTENYEMTGLVCDTADIAIVSRAIRADRCRSGAQLVTLRTLRRTGSLAIHRGESEHAEATPSIDSEPEEWNLHRLAAWPEYWRKPNPELAPTTE